MTPDDVPHVTEMWKDYIDYHAKLDAHWQRSGSEHALFRSDLEARLDETDTVALVAAHDDYREPVGFCLCDITTQPMFGSGPAARINDLYVKVALRGQSIGTQLAATAMDVLRDRGVQRIEANAVLVANSGARKFWRALGFTPFQERLAWQV